MPSVLPNPRGGLYLSEYPELCAQLDREYNDLDIDPDEIRHGSGKRLWWRCKEGPDHIWEQRVCNRTRGSGCPFCAGVQVSVTNSLATRNPEVAAQWHPTLNKLTPSEVVAGPPSRRGSSALEGRTTSGRRDSSSALSTAAAVPAAPGSRPR
ncbi:MAG: zinc-ribbon domain-containing protein [Myxococcales bacterium]|nr:zinc-ribbon domain-containing protein [Myxococcales bacterium]